MRDTTMYYDRALDRWSVKYGGKDYGLHCGEPIDLILHGRPCPGRLERGESWYVIVGGVELGLRVREVYRIRI